MSSGYKDFFILTVCFIESAVLGGALMGWPSLNYVLQKDGIYSHLCERNASLNGSSVENGNQSSSEVTAITCASQKVRLSIAPTVALCAFGLAAFPIGWTFDRWGLRPTRTFGLVLGVLTYIFLSLVDPGRDWMVYPGAAFLGLSSYTLRVTNSHVALLAGTKASTVIALYVSTENTYFTSQLIKIAYDNGIPRKYCLGFLGFLWILVFFSTWILLPAYKIGTYLPRKREPVPLPKEEEVEVTLREKSEALQEKKPQHQQSLKEHLLRVDFGLLLFFLCALHVRNMFIMSSFHHWISGILDGWQPRESYFINLLAYGTLVGALITPLFGILTDFLKAKTPEEKRSEGTFLIPALMIVIILVLGATIPAFFRSESAIYTCVTLFCIVNTATYSVLTIYVTHMTPRHIYGSVLGIANVGAGITSILVNVYTMWMAYARSFLPVTIVHTISIILTFSLPLKMLYNTKQSSEVTTPIETGEKDVKKCTAC